MNEGRQITKEQAEACMRADAEFATAGWLLLYRVSDGRIIANDKTNDFNGDGWIEVSSWNHERAYTIHADPNNTFERLFGTERELESLYCGDAHQRRDEGYCTVELTFEEVGAALFREDSIWLKRDGLWCQVKMNRSGHFYHRVINGVTWETFDDFRPEEDKYTLYKEPTEPTPQPEPLTLEALEARVKALEEKK